MARTTIQIENDIDNSITLKVLEYVKDYLTIIVNSNTEKLNTTLQDIYNHINGLDQVVGHVGKPLAPAATEPTTANEYDWFFDTTTQEFKMFHNGAWQAIAHISSTIDAYTKAESDGKYAELDLSNVNVGAANAGKIIIVNDDGTLSFDNQQHHLWIVDGQNHFVGTFTSKAQHDTFMAITNDIPDSSFESETHLTTVILPNVETIGVSALQDSPLTSLDIPKAQTIGNNALQGAELTNLDLPKAITIGEYAFEHSKLTSLSLPEATTIGSAAFFGSKLTSLNLPKATTIGGYAFSAIVNDASTTVTMKSKFNTDAEKDRVFGTGRWTNVTFTWV